MIKGNKKKTVWKGTGGTENLNARACLISGPPGIGIINILINMII